MFKYPIPKAQSKYQKKDKKKKKNEQENRYEQHQVQQQHQQQNYYHQPPTPPPPSSFSNYHQPPTNYFQQSHSQTPPSLHTTQNLSAWFDYFDVDRGGTLDREEVIRGLQQTIRNNNNNNNTTEEGSDPQTIRDTVYSVWCVFDHDGSGVIERAEFCAGGGLGESLVAMLESSYSGGGGGGVGIGSSTIDAATAGGPIAEIEPEIEVMPSSSYDRQEFMGVPIPPGINPGRTMSVTLRPGDTPRNITVPERDEWHYGKDGRAYFLTPTEVPTVEVPTVQAVDVPEEVGGGASSPVIPYVPVPGGGGGGGFSDGGGGGGGGVIRLPTPPPYNPNAFEYR